MLRWLQRYGFFFFIVALGCAEPDNKKFRLVPSSESGVTFRNRLTETADFNIFNYMYFYNGGGVAVGDLNGDDLQDIFFTSNQESEKLYLNLGAFKFKDVTTQAGVSGIAKSWTTGVTFADVNADGRLDIYVSCVGDYLMLKAKNQLYINQGNDEQGVPRFAEQGSRYGLDLVGFGTQAAFFDYDLDGDLDMFMLNHSLHQQGTFGRSSLRKDTHPLAGDRLMRNDEGIFKDVAQLSGIYSSVLGYGLGVVVSDINLDGYPDLYVGNDFHENDYLYINQGDGTFREVVESALQHTSRYTMGVDMADFNNDLFPDLISMDMLPSDPRILKSAMAEDPYEVYQFKLKYGYNHQFARNTLQLNNRNGTFSDIALYAGVFATDWSWSTFFADMNLDGHKDIFVANGIRRRSNDLDYINFIEVDSIQRKISGKMGERELQYIEKMPEIKIPNFLFVNNGDSTFSNKSQEWGLDQKSYSNGAVYADLDNDGDLDLVVNNIEDEAFLYENLTLSRKATDVNFLQVVLKGPAGNPFAVGAKVIIYDSARTQLQECFSTRGYQSSVDHILTFGLGESKLVDSVVVVWNTNQFQTFRNIKPNQRLVLKYSDSATTFDYSILHSRKALFEEISDTIGISYKHVENVFPEFDREQLIPHMMSAEGPACAVADIDGDGREDIFLGGSKRQQAKIFRQVSGGKFLELPQRDLSADSIYEDIDAEFFDADKDGDLDLLVASGGNEYTGKSEFLSPRLYINNGVGELSRSKQFSEIFLTASCVALHDYDQDGDIDVFIGARAIPWKYGVKPDSYLLVNDGQGNFSNVTNELAPGLLDFGFVKDALWVDIDRDQDHDLVVAAEWRQLSIFLNNNGKLSLLDVPDSGLEKSNGWWSSLATGDFDGDGDMDLIAGNLGLNSKLKASIKQPVRMYVDDFDKNESVDQLVSHYMQGKEYPFHTRDELTKQMPYLKKTFLSYQNFARATFRDVFKDDQLENAQLFVAYEFNSSYVENLGDLKFRITPLPRSAQFSTTNAIAVDDLNGDGFLDVLLAGNFYPVNVQRGRYDASFGSVLLGNGKGRFKSLPGSETGFTTKGETRAIQKLKIGDVKCYLAIRNNDSLKIFRKKE